MKRARKSQAKAAASAEPTTRSAAPAIADTPTTWIDRGLLALVIVATFARGLFTPLQRSWDDGRFIIDSPLAHTVSWDNFVAIVGARHFEAYHPLHLLSYWLDVPWFGASPFVIHVTSLGLWVIAGACVLSAVRALGVSRVPAWIATALCMVHPVQVEAVTWATGRKDVLALLFSALAIVWHLRSERFADRAAWLSRLLFLCAALSKTSVATLPLWLMLLDAALSRRTLRSAFVHQLPALLVMAGLGSITVLTWQASEMLRTHNANEPTLLWRWATTLTRQLFTALWPANNAPMYRSHGWAEPSVFAWIGPFLCAATSVTCWRSGLRRAAVGALGFAVLLLPESNLVPMVFPIQDRYVSFPLLSLSFMVGALLDRVAATPTALRRVTHFGAACVALLGARTTQYQGAWRDELTLWQHATSTQPQAYYAWMKLGEVQRDAGDLANAAHAYRQMVSTEPSLEVGHAALFHALVLLDEQRQQLPASAPMDLARRFVVATHDAAQMHQLSQELIARGYDQAAAMALDYALTLQPFPASVLSQNAERFERARRKRLADVLRRHEKRSAQQP